MELKTGIYEVLNADETNSVHGDFESIETTHVKKGWIKNLETQAVSNVTLTNFSMPLIPGSKLGIAFLSDQIIAFKRSTDIPVEDPVSGRMLRNIPVAIAMALLLALAFSIPVLGYISGAVWGAFSLITGHNILGRYKKFKGNRLYGLFLLSISLIAWIPAQMVNGDLGGLFGIYISLAIFMVAVTVSFQIYKVCAENRVYERAVAELNNAWRK